MKEINMSSSGASKTRSVTEGWIHILFLLLGAPTIIGLNRFAPLSELILLCTFCFILCCYFHVIFHQKTNSMHTVQVEILTSIRDMLSKKMNTKIIYMGKDGSSSSSSDEETLLHPVE